MFRTVTGKLFVVLAVAGLLTAAMAPSVTHAARRNTLTDGIILTVTGNGANGSVLAGDEMHVTGSGFVPDSDVYFETLQCNVTFWGRMTADAAGRISFTDPTGVPGTYTMWASQYVNGKKPTLMATLSFEAVSP